MDFAGELLLMFNTLMPVSVVFYAKLPHRKLKNRGVKRPAQQEEEATLLMLLGLLPERVVQAAQAYRPSLIARYLLSGGSSTGFIITARS